ncbi:MAG: phospholipase D-like domain-containing protein [Anaerolineales bacterium]
MRKIFFILLALIFALSACSIVESPARVAPAASEPAALEALTFGAGNGVRDGWFELYFTDPSSPLASQRTGGVDAPLAAAIDSAKLSVDVAVYSLSLNSIRNALINAHKRGARVRVVMESDNLERSDPQKIKDAGIPILGDRRQGLMHNKFAVIDNSEVWLGSLNFTDSGAYDDNNNLMRIRSVKMAENYTKEFEEMFLDDKFGPDVVAETPNPLVTIDGTEMQVYFSPDDGAQAHLLEALNAAQESVYFMAFSFTSNEVGAVVLQKAEEGLSVRGVMEEEQVKSNIGTEYDAFKQAGLNVRIDGNAGQMHHKVIIIDERVVVFGSYNFTNSAETRNDENMVIIDNAEIASYFVGEFQTVYAQGK